MTTITNVRKVWDNDVESPYPAIELEDIDELKRRTGATHVVAIRWTFCGREYESRRYVRVLPDQASLVYCDGNGSIGKHLIVLNGDGTERITIAVPRINATSRPEEGYLTLPPSSAHFGGIEWGCEGNDGYTDYLFDFDWHSGALLRYARPTRPW